MVIVEGWVRSTPESLERLREAAVAMIAATRAEDGCLEYSYAADLAEPGMLRVIERWRDEAALQAHFATPHMQTFAAAMAQAEISAMLVKAYAAEEARTLIER